MSDKGKGANYSQGRIDTVIGAGVCIEGRLTFKGVLRLDGEALGDISCDADANGTLVVGKSGAVAGKVDAPHIVVAGRIAGPVHSSASIEIHPGASVVGDVGYRDIEIHAGGLVDGVLIQEGPSRQAAAREDAGPIPVALSTGRGSEERSGRERRLGAAVALLVLVVAVAAVMWAKRDPAPSAPPLVAAVPDAEPSANAGVPAPVAAQQDNTSAAAGSELAPLPNPAASGVTVAQAPPADPAKVVLVQGVNPAKPAGVLLVIAKEPSTLFKKRRNDAGDGTRIDVAEAATNSIPVTRNEVLRVASGRDITLIYQGRKVPPKAIESGAWMSFAPQSSSGSGEEK